MRLGGFSRILAGAASAVLLVACSPQDTLAPTPSIYVGQGAKPMLDNLQSADGRDDFSLLYVTDRAPVTDPATGALTYGAGRSRFLSFGSVDVSIREPVATDPASASSASASKSEMKLGAANEIGRFPEEPYAAVMTPSGVRRSPEVVAAHQQAVAVLQAEISRRLEKTKRKEVVVFIHGYNNTFKDAVSSMADICHFLGQEFVCVALTWPAGGTGGVFMGYNVDRESGEFAVADMKKAIRAISGAKGVQGVHFIAHSRGTDVLTSAIQQLAIEAYVSRSSVAQQLKAKNLILFAPDMDIDVASTKMFGMISDPDAHYGSRANPNGVFPQGSVHATIYSSPDDKALGMSSFLFGSQERLGQQNLDNPDTKALGKDPARGGLADFIEVDGQTDTFGHGYFLSNPAVSSDLVALVRYGLKPGDPGRPLIEIGRPYWRIATARPGPT